ncbi:phenylacetate--CoA ligase family protein [Rhabdaerophilum sp.]|uniref:phenylacetate--CoA ligase family protein n=1 Tax=Rhabdaerophilum sp. TaxID=2717341 RepID=UPI0022C50A5A|nr:AMP-binding protein [Beijerinckiaceae bacterium]
MPSHFDRLETRSPEKREAEDFRTLRALLTDRISKAPALKKQLKGIDIRSLKNRAALGEVPVFRKSNLLALQKEKPPFAGLAATKTGALKRLLMSPGPIFDPEGHAGDWWGAGRAFFAGGMRKGDVVLNTFSYHFTPGGFIFESGAHAIGAAVIPAGPGQTEQQLDAIEALRPNAYAGTPDFLKILIEKAIEAGRPVTSIRKAMVSGAAFPPSLQAFVKDHGIVACQCYATADLGIVAYESLGQPGLIINEGLIVEIVKPGTNEALPEGEVGEIVVTRLNADYPLLRFGTGDLSKIIPGRSPCGRTNQRLAGWMGRADQRTKVKGMFVDPAQIEAVRKAHPGLGRLRLVVMRKNEQDTMTLRAESGEASPSLASALAASLQTQTRLRGEVELVEPGSLPNDGKIIADERPIG